MTIVTADNGILQLRHHIRVEGMVFLAVHILQQTTGRQRFAGLPGHSGQLFLVLLEVIEVRTLNTAGYAFEAKVHHTVGQTNGLEQLGTPIGGNGGDPHLGQDLQQALVDALAVIVLGLDRVHQHFAGADQVVQHLVGQVRIHRGGTKAEQHRKVVRVPGPAGFHDDVGIATQAVTHQVMVHSAGSHQGVDGQFTFRQPLVAQNQQYLGTAHSIGRLLADAANRLLQPLFRAVAQGNVLNLEARAIVVADLQELGRGQHRRGQDDPVGVVRGFLEHVLFGTQTRLQRHHNGLAERVDGRVGYLGKLLPEVIRHVANLAGQHRHGGIVTHRANSFLGAFTQGPQHLVPLFKRDIEHLLVHQQVVRFHQPELGGGLVQGGFDTQGVAPQPALVRLGVFQPLIDIRGVQYFAGLGVDGEHLARPYPALGNHVVRGVAVGADFRCQCNKVILGNHPARRAQAVTVEHTQGVAAVGHNQTGRTIPGLHVHGVVFVEGAQVRVHGLNVLPCRRNHHPHSTEQVHATGQQDFQHVVHAGGVRTGQVHQRLQGLQVRQGRRAELGCPGNSPVTVAVNGVDFTIVGQEPERLRQGPARHGVGREPLVEHADRGLQVRVVQILVEVSQVGRHHQAFVGQGAVRQAADVELGVIRHIPLGMAAANKHADGKVLLRLSGRQHEHLLNAGHTIPGHRAQATVVYRHFPPAHDFQALLGQSLFNRSPSGRSPGFLRS